MNVKHRVPFLGKDKWDYYSLAKSFAEFLKEKLGDSGLKL